MTKDSAFWDRIAPKYATDAIKDMPAYEYTLGRTRSYLTGSDRVLEVGCGTGSTALLIAPGVATITATDVAPGMIAIGRAKAKAAGVDNITFAVAGLGDADIAGLQFDAVLAFNLLHLVPDPEAGIAAVHRHLKPGGLFISKTPCLIGIYRLMRLPVAVMRLFGRAPQVRFFSPDWLEAAIRRQGFDIVESGDHPQNPPRRYIVARKRQAGL